MTSGRLDDLTSALVELDEKLVLELVRTALAEGTSSLDVIRACERGMRGVGERYEREEYYLSGLIMAGEIFREVMTLTQPGFELAVDGTASGKVLLGTVAGDIHNIGKNMVRMALRNFGFTVDDLGVDVAPERFVDEAVSFQPDVVGLSCLLSTSYDSLKDTIAALREHVEIGRRIPVIIGGATLDERVATYADADYWTTDVMEGVRVCQTLTSGKGEPEDHRHGL